MKDTKPTAKSTSSSASVESPFANASIDREQWLKYERRMLRVIAHVYDHLDEQLDLNALADIAYLSPHHWHRIYHAMYGETLADTVKRLRLHRAAGELAQSSKAIVEVAKSAGYPNLQSFNRTFKSVYEMPPARYRAAGEHRQFVVSSVTQSTGSHEIAIRSLEEIPVLAFAQQGSYMEIGRAFDSLFARLAAAGLARPGMRMFGIFFDDPSSVPANLLRAQAAVAGCEMPDTDCGLLRTTIAASDYALLVHTGPYSSMKAAYQWLFGDWLPRSNYEPASGPVIEEYLNSPRETAPRDLRTHIYLPVKKGAQ